MITNTVIIFLRELLPIFILYSYISTLRYDNADYNPRFWLKSCAISLVVTLVIYSFIEQISASFEGKGLEITYSFAFALMWLGFSLASTLDKRLPRLVVVSLNSFGFIILTSFKSAEFLIFFGVFGQSDLNLLPVVLGCIMGLGICLSFTILLKFILGELQKTRAGWFFSILWSAFLAGQFSQISIMLSQVDVLEGGLPAYSTVAIINDASEYGHLLHALIGYESSPSLIYIGFYISAFLLLLLLEMIFKKRAPAPTHGGVHA